MGTAKRTAATTYYDKAPEAYGYLDGKTLVLKYDGQRASHDPNYEIPDSATEAAS